MLLANNIMLIGFHVLTGAKVLNTLSDHSQCTVVFNITTMLMGSKSFHVKSEMFLSLTHL